MGIYRNWKYEGSKEREEISAYERKIVCNGKFDTLQKFFTPRPAFRLEPTTYFCTITISCWAFCALVLPAAFFARLDEVREWTGFSFFAQFSPSQFCIPTRFCPIVTVMDSWRILSLLFVTFDVLLKPPYLSSLASEGLKTRLAERMFRIFRANSW